MKLFDSKAAIIFGALVISSAFLNLKQTVPADASQNASNASEERRDWPAYGGAAENTHYSGLAQINRTNVKELAVAWSFDTGEQGGLQTSPIIVDRTLYGINRIAGWPIGRARRTSAFWSA
jgi:quinoprotein glucose dehydrogenase